MSGTLVCALRYFAPQPSSRENDPTKANTLLASSSVAFWLPWQLVPSPEPEPALRAAVAACLRSSGLSRAPHAAAVSTASSTRAVTRTRRIAGPPLGIGTGAPGRRLVSGTVEGPSLQHKGRT